MFQRTIALVTLWIFLCSNVSFALRPQSAKDRIPAAPGESPEPYLVKGDYEGGPVAVLGKVGGTSIGFKIGLPNGLLGDWATGRTPNNKTNTPEEVVEAIVRCISAQIDKVDAANVSYVYFSAPGFFTPDMKLTGAAAVNIPCLPVGFSFAEAVGRRLNEKYPRPPTLGPIPVIVVHDGTAGGLGEASVFGSHPGAKNLFFVIAGTGFGTRFIQDGKPVLGDERVDFFINEIPHCLVWTGDDYIWVGLETGGMHPDFANKYRKDGTTPNPYYGKEDAEDRCVGAGIARYALTLARSGTFDTGVVEQLRTLAPGGELRNITTKELGMVAKEGNPLALKAIQDRGRELGIALAVGLVECTRSNEFKIWPPYIVIGSGVAQIGEIFLNAVKAGFRERLTKYAADKKASGFNPDEIDKVVDTLELSQLPDDMARELLGGLPSQAQIDEHSKRISAMQQAATAPAGTAAKATATAAELRTLAGEVGVQVKELKEAVEAQGTQPATAAPAPRPAGIMVGTKIVPAIKVPITQPSEEPLSSI